jgi:riboflavin kinase / FMN adenylyltransferase
MEIIRVTGRPSRQFSGCAAAVGNFDSVHLGHQALVRRARERALELGMASGVVTFEPPPLEFLSPDTAPARLMLLRDKCSALAELGVDRLYVLRFDSRLQRLAPAEFELLLTRTLAVRHVVVGEGFRYAARRAGDTDSLVAAGARLGFGVDVVGPVTYGGERVSSTRVRNALLAGDLPLVRALLGRAYRICGRVVQGARLGRKLGFATANMRLHRRTVPLWGIYAVRALIAGRLLPAVASVGTRPTIAIGSEPLLETHLFDFDADLYGRYLAVDFIAKLRDEERFPDLDALVAQMREDARQARAILERDAA